MRIFADTADINEIDRLASHPWVSGFTTNPTLHKQATNPASGSYARWAKYAVQAAGDLPISIDGPPAAVWDLGLNAIPKMIINDARQAPPSRSRPINFTAVLYSRQIPGVAPGSAAISYVRGDIISVFAGRIRDTGRSAKPVIDTAKSIGGARPYVLWASARELHHIYLADQSGCDIITLSPELIGKMDKWWGMPLEAAAQLTIDQFAQDRAEWE